MYQTIYNPATQPKFSAALLQTFAREFAAMNFMPEEFQSNRATFRDGERYISFLLEDETLTIRLGVGSHDGEEAKINSMRLDEMVAFLFGGLKRGCHCTNDAGLEDCLASAMKDLREFANEFLRGDFRPFLRILAIKKREERDAEKAKKELAEKIYLA